MDRLQYRHCLGWFPADDTQPLFQRSYNVIWTLWTLDGRCFDVVCRLGYSYFDFFDAKLHNQMREKVLKELENFEERRKVGTYN